MRRILVIAALLVAAAAFADQITVDSIITAFKMGATADKMIATINDPANSVAAIGAADVAKLRAAAVPEPVIQAMLTRAPSPTATPAPSKPDDPRLVEIVRLVRTGLSESLVIEHLKRTGERYNPSTNDLVYLKENQTPDAVIAALVASSVPPTPTPIPPGTTPTPAPPEDAAIDGLVFVRGAFQKNHQGRVSVKGDDFSWMDATEPASSFSVKLSALERAWLKCRPLPGGNFCFELGFGIFKGDEYSFRDAKSDQGGNDQVKKLRAALSSHLPNLIFEEKISK